ncbi:uncharacterized protein TRIADDRAFT_52679 [Trichoplax adhaerens]|uniref:RNA helicase n=1 Tax=Trichoplax adhaerens TaxID=10228 RepID=B3RJU3_TRIAD|nr:hypothetical protein TRIADDRAFT_52679 [Trichoplax adhaerens]EDV29844.1 hypothetical protein TRIADDRAFT_52679 [Trichoplax adhaerens]|eukprot:XP_002109046.1 hypothetical protein TRIADDRAFT_52679 [Trichoplax adhaerens]
MNLSGLAYQYFNRYCFTSQLYSKLVPCHRHYSSPALKSVKTRSSRQLEVSRKHKEFTGTKGNTRMRNQRRFRRPRQNRILDRPSKTTIKKKKEEPRAITDSGTSSFSRLFLRDDVIDSLANINITTPTAIQSLAIPKIAAGKNVLCASETGSGKTIAYLAPLIHRIKEEEEKCGLITRLNRPRACIVVPSRELAQQTLKVAKSLCHVSKYRVVGVIGGKKQKLLEKALETPTDVVVATPGMLIKYHRYNQIFFSDLTHLVLDEADTLFDESFYERSLEILEKIKIRGGKPMSLDTLQKDAQVTVVGATLPKRVEAILNPVIPNLKKVTTKGFHKLLPHIQQDILKLKQTSKAGTLLKLLKERRHGSTIIFCNTVDSCNWLGHYLAKVDLPLLRLHGGMPPEERLIRYDKFQRGEYNILIATDIASRGLDTKNVECVINFDFPISVADYIHRAGRTGRVGSKCTGRVISLVSSRKELSLTKLLEEAAARNTVIDELSKKPKRYSKKKLAAVSS